MRIRAFPVSIEIWIFLMSLQKKKKKVKIFRRFIFFLIYFLLC